MTISLPDPSTADVVHDELAPNEDSESGEGSTAVKATDGAKNEESGGGCDRRGRGGGWRDGKDGFVGRGLGGLWGENGDLRGRGVEETLSILVREELAAEGLIGEGEKELEGLGDDARGSEDIT